MSKQFEHTLTALSGSLRELSSKNKMNMKQLDRLCEKYAAVIDKHVEELREPKRAFRLGERLLNAKPSKPEVVSSALGKIARQHRGQTFGSNAPIRKPRAAKERELRARGRGRER